MGVVVGTVSVKAQEVLLFWDVAFFVLGSHACIHVFFSSTLLFVRWTSQLDESATACFFLPSSARRHLKWAFRCI